MRKLFARLLRISDVRGGAAADCDAVCCSRYEYVILQGLFCGSSQFDLIFSCILIISVRCCSLLKCKSLLGSGCRQVVRKLCVICLDGEAATCVCLYLSAAVIQCEGRAAERRTGLILLVDGDLVMLTLFARLLCIRVNQLNSSVISWLQVRGRSF